MNNLQKFSAAVALVGTCASPAVAGNLAGTGTDLSLTFPIVSLDTSSAVMSSIHGPTNGATIPLGPFFTHSSAESVDIGLSFHNFSAFVGARAKSEQGESFVIANRTFETRDIKASAVVGAGMSLPFGFTGNKNVKGVFALGAFVEATNLSVQTFQTDLITGDMQTYPTGLPKKNQNFDRGIGMFVAMHF